MNGRAVQDEVIRYLVDARVRAQAPETAPITVEEGIKAARFAHFLARRYYRDRLVRSFRYSHRFRRLTGLVAEEVVDSDEFELFLHNCMMGSLESAKRVGEMARAHLAAIREPGPWWQELLEYEYLYFLQAATSERNPPGPRPHRSLSAVCRQFEWALPDVLARLRSGEAIGDELRCGATLLFSRTREGRIYVIEIESVVEKVFGAVDGLRCVEQIALITSQSAEPTRRMLAALADIGAVSITNSTAPA